MATNKLLTAIFDVDGTLSETERLGHRVAFNRAFQRLGLDDHWDEEMYGQLLMVTGGERRLTHYYMDYRHLGREEAAALAAKIQPVKTQIFLEVVISGDMPARAGALRLLQDLDRAGIKLAVATTGSRGWVLPLVNRFKDEAQIPLFSTVITGDDVAEKKPDPEAFELAMTKLGQKPNDVVIVEDSYNGVTAAKAAGCACVAVQGEYSTPAQLMAADLVVDSYGDDQAPLRVLHNPYDVAVGPLLNAQTLRAVHAGAIA